MRIVMTSTILALTLALMSPIVAVGTVSAEETTIVSNQRFSIVKNN